MNPFDLEEDEQQQPGPSNPELDSMLEFGRERQQSRETAMRRSVLQTADQAPDTAAEARRLSLRLGVPADTVRQNLPAYRQQSEVEKPYTQIQQQSPHTAAFIAKPENHAIAKDDLENLGALEWFMQAPMRAWTQGVNQVQFAMLRNKSITQDLTPEESKQLQTYREEMDRGGALGTEGHWFRGAVTGSMKLLPMMFGGSMVAATRAAQGAVTFGTVGAALGATGGITAPFTALAGFTGGLAAGALEGGFEFAAQMESGLAYDEMLAMTDEHGQPYDPQVAKAAALAVGAINGALELGGEVLIAKTFGKLIPGVETLQKETIRATVAKALRVPAIRTALKDAMVSWGEAVGGNVIEEVAQKAVSIVGSEVTKAASGRGAVEGQVEPGNVNLFAQPSVENDDGTVSTIDSLSINVDGREILIPTVTPDGRHLREADAIAEYERTGRHLGKFRDAASATAFATQLHNDYAAGRYAGTQQRTVGQTIDELLQEGAGAFQSMVLMPVPGVAMSVVADVRRARAAQHNQTFFKGLSEGIKQSKTFERFPGAVQELLDEALKAGPIKEVYAPTDTFAEYWQSQGVDPAQMATELTGDPDAWKRAVDNQTDLPIPTARYAVKLAGTAHNTYFANELRLGDPNAMNGREYQVFQKIEATIPTETPDPATAQVRADLEAQLRQAGVPERMVSRYARVVEAFSATIGGTEQIDPRQVVGPLQVKRPDVQQKPVEKVVAEPDTTPPAASEEAVEVDEAPPVAAAAAATEAPPAAAVPAPAPAQTPAQRAATAESAGPRAEAAIARATDTAPELLPSGTKDRLRAAGIDLEVIDRMTQAEANAALRPPLAVGAPIPGARPLSDYAPEDLANEAARVEAMRSGVRVAAPARVRPQGSDILVQLRKAQELEDLERADRVATGQGLRDSAAQQRQAGAGGTLERAGDGDRLEPGRLQTPGIPGLDETFERQAQEVNQARITPEVTRELERILEEMQTFPFTERTWTWLGPTEKKTGNAAGGAANIVEGGAGASVYNDVLGFSPLNRVTVGKNKGQPAKGVHGSRAAVIAAVQAVLDNRDIKNNLAEGAVRVAEHRNAGIWTDLSHDITTLPPAWGTVASESFTNALSEAIDLATAPEADLLSDSTAVDQELEGDTSFDVSSFDQPGKRSRTLEEMRAEMQARRDQVETERVAIGEDVRAIELTDPNGSTLTVTRSTSKPGVWQVTRFLSDGTPAGHMEYPSLQQAFESSRGLYGSKTYGPSYGGAEYRVTQVHDRAGNVREFDQGLFDEPEPQVDTLDTGELQPRVPGTEAARKVGKAATSFRAPVQATSEDFNLTAEGEAPADTGQRELFQSAYHGSPHIFERFSLHALGTGEGAQAYGWGLYFAGNREVADYYREALAGQKRDKQLSHTDPDGEQRGVYEPGGLYQRYIAIRDQGTTVPPSPNSPTERAARARAGRIVNGLNELHGRAYFAKVGTEGLASIRRDLEISNANMERQHAEGRTFSGDKARDLRDYEARSDALYALDQLGDKLEITPPERPGRTYTVEIPEDEDYLHYDRTASQQPPKIQAALRLLGVKWDTFTPRTINQMLRWFETLKAQRLAAEDIGIRETLREGLHYAQTGDATALEHWQRQHQGLINDKVNDPTGDRIYNQLQTDAVRLAPHLSMKEAARYASTQLNQVGIAGIKYLDGASRSAGEGSYNYVVFDDKLVEIKEFDQPLRGELADADVQAFAAQTKQQIGLDLEQFEVLLDSQGNLKLHTLIVDRASQRTGIGTEAMQALVRFADEHGKRIVLSPAQPSDQLGTTSRSRLVKFYRRFGFIENTGRRADPSVSESMYREPTLRGEGLDLGQPLFHGSPHDFDAFSTSKIGTGEGAQAYGWGLYFAENESIARGYRDRLSDPSVTVGGQKMAVPSWSSNLPPEPRLIRRLADAKGRTPTATTANVVRHVRTAIEHELTDRYNSDESRASLQAQLALLDAAAERGIEISTGSLYQVDIPDAQISKMLDWDLPLEQQPANVKVALKQVQQQLAPKLIDTMSREELIRILQNNDPNGTYDDAGTLLEFGEIISTEDLRELAHREGLDEYLAADMLAEGPHVTGQSLYRQLTAIAGGGPSLSNDAQRIVSEAMRAAGIPGLRYFDQGSRGPTEVYDVGAPRRSFGPYSHFTDKAAAQKHLEMLRREGFADAEIKTTVHPQTRNVVVFDDSIIELTHKDGSPVGAKERKEFLQVEDDKPKARAGRRGSIRFGAGLEVSIQLFTDADSSTLIHEFGHLFLERMRQLRTRPEASERLGGMMATLDQWFVDNKATTEVEQHELFARAFEQYALEGNAPSLALRDVFSAFRAWMLGIYRSLKGLNVPLTDDVRQVFDRMLATDQAIEQAKAISKVAPMFLTAEAAGMSAKQFSLYAATVADASKTERERLQRKLLAEVQREQEADWREERDEIQGQVTAELWDRPVYRALAAMRTGTNPDGTPLIEGVLEAEPLRLSRTLLVQAYGEGILKTLPAGIYSREGGLHADLVAERTGFTSGAEMLRAIVGAPPLGQAIEQETQRRMLERHGSIMTDGSILEEAQAAIANEDRERIIRAELKALNQLRRVASPFVRAGEAALRDERRERAYERRWFEAETKLRIAIAEGHKQAEIDELAREVKNLRQKARGGPTVINAGIPPAGLLRETARARIAALPITDIKPQLFWSASRRGAQAAIDAAARQDFEAAITAKQQELLNLALYREAVRVREDVDARHKAAVKLDSKASRQAVGLAGGTYQDQIDGLLDRYELATISRKALDRRTDLRKWVAAMEGEGLPVDVPEEVLNEARRINWQEATVEEFVAVTDALQHIAHLARFKNRLLKLKQARDLNTLATTLGTSIRDKFKGKPPTPEIDRRPTEEGWRMVSDFFASHRKLASFLREMDGLEDGGPMTDAIMFTLNDAGNREAVMTADATKRLQALVDEAFPGRLKATLYNKIHIPAIGSSLSHMSRLMVALNWGNEGNRERVRKGNKWSDEQVTAILNTLSASDMQFVQGIFDLFESYRPEMAAKQKRVTGIEPTWVEAMPITTAAGTFRGGYFPLKSDDRQSAAAIKFADLSTANLAQHAAYGSATTQRGHLKDRVQNVRIPVRLDFGPIYEHLGQVIHDLTHHEALLDVGRILGHREVSQAILETHGDQVYKQMRNAIKDIAFGTVPARGGFEKIVNHLRQGATVVGLAWNMTTTLMQPLGLTNSVNRIGAKWVGKGLGRWMTGGPQGMVATVGWINERSTMMRMRAQTQQREIAEIRQSIGVSTGRISGWVDAALQGVTRDAVTKQGIADSYFWFIQQAQRFADVPTWLGEYEKAMAAGDTEERAIHRADQAVLDSQGGGQVKDLSEVQRGGPMMKLWTNFYSFFNVVHQQHMEAHARFRLSEKDVGAVGRLASDYVMLYILPATLGFAIRNGLKGEAPDDDETFLALLAENASYLAGTMLGFREVAGALQGTTGYEGPAGARAFASMARFGVQLRQVAADGAEALDAPFWKSLNEVGGILFHYPASQVNRTIGGYTALMEGKTQNPMALLVGAPRAKK